ncbi:MAG TPA: glycosyltransferase family 87 protein [Acidobacteriaceae bacterium]
MKRISGARLWLGIALLATVASVPKQLHDTLRMIPSHWSDFYSQWMGTGALFHGTDPYTASFTHTIEFGFYGKTPDNPKADTQAFVYPAHAAFVLWPLSRLPWRAARIALTALLPPLVALSAWMWMALGGLTRHRWMVVALVACSWPAIWAYQQTQLTVVVLAAVAAGCFLLSRNLDVLAGILFALATIKPNLAGLVILWLVVQMAIQRRWRFLSAFCVGTAGLVVASMILFPGWIGHWIIAAREYSNTPFKLPLLSLMLGHVAGMALAGALAAGVVWRLWRLGVAAPSSAKFNYAVALILALTVCLIPTTIWMIYNELALIPAVLLIFSDQQRSHPIAAIARFGIYELLGIVPLCALVAAFLGPSTVLEYLPFVNLLIPPLLVIAVASSDAEERITAPSLAPAAA